MESLNLNTLASSLPAGQQNAEKELANNFRAAALSITTLYRSSRKNSKRAHNTGYAKACQDLLDFVQQGVSASGDATAVPVAGPSSAVLEGGGMTIGRVMDWAEARLLAIKVQEEDEEEDEEREKEKDRAKSKSSTVASAAAAAAAAPSIPKSSVVVPVRDEHSSPSPGPPSRAHRSNQPPPPPPLQSLLKIPPPAVTASPPPPPAFTDATPLVIGAAGTKRRHAIMMLDSSSSPLTNPGGPGGTAAPPANAPSAFGFPGSAPSVHVTPGSTATFLHRRRTRSSRNLAHGGPPGAQNQNLAAFNAISGAVMAEAMDVEDDSGRERKRVARR